ncbi:MAG: hypothetical protein L3J04_05825 [Robiginitomaculum sp.]|nr:hypothetical protein [Robiginitomaculum sp.]
MAKFTTCIGLISGVFLLNSCTGLTIPNSIKPNYVMTANGPQKVGFSQPIPASLIQQFADDYSVSWCKSQSIPGKFFLSKTYEESTSKVAEIHVQCGATATISISSSLAAQKMTKSGFRLMDSVCSSYFRRLGNQDQDLDFYSRTINDMSGVTSAILGVTGVNAKSLAITNTLFAGANAGLESFDAIYHFSPDLQAVENMVSRAGEAYEGQLFTDSAPKDFYDAVKAVENYQRICQTSNIRALVNQAIEKSKLTAASRTTRNLLIRNNVTNTQIGLLSEDIEITSISQATLVWLTAGVTGKILKEDLPKLYSLLEVAGITDAESKFELVRKWLDNLAKSEPNSYEALLSRVDQLDPSALPSVEPILKNNELRKELMKGSQPVNAFGPGFPRVE